MDCNHARLLLTFARDRADLDQSEAEGLEDHLSLCPDCANLAATEQRLDLALGRAMRDVPVPAGLKGRLLAAVARPAFSWRRRLIAGAAIAAALLVSVALSWYL